MLKTTVNKPHTLQWSSHVPKLFSEVLNNASCSILYRPLQITLSILGEVAERAAELDDPIMNALMCRLTLYSVSDPDHEDYDAAVVSEVKRYSTRSEINACIMIFYIR